MTRWDPNQERAIQAAFDGYVPGDELKAAKAEIGRLQAAKRRALAIADERGKENDRLRTALEEVVNPLKFMRERAEAEGCHLSGMAYSIANSVAHLQDVAKRALEQPAAEGGKNG